MRASVAAGAVIALLSAAAPMVPSGAAPRPTARPRPVTHSCHRVVEAHASADAFEIHVAAESSSHRGCDSRRRSPSAASQQQAIHADFDGDGKTDVLVYTPGTGADSLFYGTSSGFVPGRTVSINGDYSWTVGDFNGDGHDDIVWYEAEHPVASSVWYGVSRHHGFSAHQLVGPTSTTADQYVPGAGEFNGDHRADLLWLDTGTGGPTARSASYVWYGTHHGFDAAKSGVPTPPCNPDRVSGVQCVYMWRDFNGDGEADFLYYRSGAASDALWYATGTGWRPGPPININGTFEPIRGDFNGDGKGDILWYSPGPDDDYVWYGRTSGFVTGPPLRISGEYIAVRGDFNGDGSDDIVWYAPGSARDYLWYGQNAGFRVGPGVAINGFYAPLVHDYNGDGKADILWYPVLSGHRSHLWYGATSGFRTGKTVQL